MSYEQLHGDSICSAYSNIQMLPNSMESSQGEQQHKSFSEGPLSCGRVPIQRVSFSSIADNTFNKVHTWIIYILYFAHILSPRSSCFLLHITLTTAL